MDREELIEVMRQGPIRITMNSGDTVEITNREMALVTPMSVIALVKSDDGKLRTRFYPLVAISMVESLSAA